MDKRTKLLTVLLSLVLLASLTMACIPGLPGLGGGATEEETPVPPPPAAETPVSEPTPPPPPSGGEELPFEMDVEALNNLDSYAYAFHFEGLTTTMGAAEHTTLNIEGRRQNRPTRAEQLSFSSTDDGQLTTLEFIYIEEQNKIWTREDGGQWEEIPVMDPECPVPGAGNDERCPGQPLSDHRDRRLGLCRWLQLGLGAGRYLGRGGWELPGEEAV
jgi:hypothetical protein